MIAHGMGDLQTVSFGIKCWNWNGHGRRRFLTTLKKSLDEDKVSTEQIDNAVRLILNTKYDLGLFQDPINIVMKTEQNWNIHNRPQSWSRKNCISIFGSA
jgi:beta-glucosidase-like glycosyl hydrolase